MVLADKDRGFFSGYELTDGLAYNIEYDLLYTELKGTIAIRMEEKVWLIRNGQIAAKVLYLLHQLL